MKKRVLLLHDRISTSAPPDELDTLIQLEEIDSALVRYGYVTERLAFSGNLLELEHTLRSRSIDVLFNLVETYYGARGLHLIPLLCETCSIAYTGAGANSLYLTGDKMLAKRMMLLGGIPTPRWLSSTDREAWPSFVSTRLIRKPRYEDASVGIDDGSVFTCDSMEALEGVIREAEAEDQLIETYIDGRECNISVVSHDGVAEILPIAEMLFTDYPVDKPKIVGYAAKWDTDSFAYSHTLRSFMINCEERALVERLQRVTRDCWKVFDCSGYGRVDVRIDGSGEIMVLEMNMNPCIARDSGFIAANAEAGLGYEEVIIGLVEEAMHG